MVTCQSSELGWEVTVELPAYFLSLGRSLSSWYQSQVYTITYGLSISDTMSSWYQSSLGDSSLVFRVFSTVFYIELFFL